MSATDKKAAQIPNHHDAKDIHAEAVTMTPYVINGNAYVNMAFLHPMPTNFFGEGGKPATAELQLVRMGTVTMPRNAAQELYKALGTLLKENEGK